jgi:fructose PTS system EIIBC or EIIC component
MMAIAMGGPINKAAYTFAVGLLTGTTFTPMAAVMAGGMTPPLSLSRWRHSWAKTASRATRRKRARRRACSACRSSPKARSRSPPRIRCAPSPSMVAGSAVVGAISMYFGCGLRAPHGGVFVLAIPNAVSHLGWYALAIVSGTLVSTAVLLVVKRPLNEPKKELAMATASASGR